MDQWTDLLAQEFPAMHRARREARRTNIELDGRGRFQAAAAGILSAIVREIPGRSMVTPWILSAACIVR